jgi:hypothetical protein
MTSDSSPSACLVERLNAALDRLEVALSACETRLDDARDASAALSAMADDRSTLAAALDVARARAAALEAAASRADAEVAVAAGAVRDALAEGGADTKPEGES